MRRVHSTIVGAMLLVLGVDEIAASGDLSADACAGRCPSNSVVSLPTVALGDAVRDASRTGADCRIAADALIGHPAEFVLVDVRPAKDVAVASIPGAANLGLESLANHLLVKTASRVVLVGDGKDTLRLMRHCRALRERGLSQIEVLDGGLPAWRRAGGAVTGDASTFDRPLRLTERDLHELLRQPEDFLMVALERPTPAIADSGVRIVKGNAGSPAKAVLRQVSSAVARKRTLVVLLPEGRDPAAWQSAARELQLAEPLFFVGATSRYDAYLEELARITEAAQRPRVGVCEKG